MCNLKIVILIITGAILLPGKGCKKPEVVNDIVFNPSITYGTLTDIDKNSYKTVIIGGKEWMAENLKTTRFNNGKKIPLVTEMSEWAYRTTPAYCWYNNDKSNKDTYGALYNWYVVETGDLCPDGWHIPTQEEFKELIEYLGGFFEAGAKLRETDTVHWEYPNLSATNETGFTALPGGYRDEHGPFDGIGIDGYWWSSTQLDSTDAWYLYLYSNFGSATVDSYLRYLGFSVRCVKDK